MKGATLDLTLSDFESGVSAYPREPIEKPDHCVVICDFDISAHRETRATGQVLRYQRADWPRLKAFPRKTNWGEFFSSSPDECCASVSDVIRAGMEQLAPFKWLPTRPDGPSWWTPE